MITARTLLFVLAAFYCCAPAWAEPDADRSAAPAAASAPRERINIDADWRFALGHATDPARDFGHGTADFFFAKAGYGDGPASPKFDDRAWRRINLPHDWGVEVPFDSRAHTAHGSRSIGPGFPEHDIGWYRKSLTISKADRSKRVAVEFDGVFRNATVWLNGHYIGQEHSGYSSFRYDLTDYLDYDGANELVVRVDASAFEGWFYEGAGIYRHVWLTRTDPLHVAHWGSFVTSAVKGRDAEITARATIANEDVRDRRFTVEQEILSPQGKRLALVTLPEQHVAQGASVETVATIPLANAALWSIETPVLHRLVTTVREGGAIRDRYVTNFGVRTIRWDANSGFWLNGRNIKLKGTNNHQDHAGLGVALPDEIQVYRLERLKAMGSNAYRASHNPPTPELLDAADRLGMLVIDEHRMMGTTPELRDQLDRMVLRDRNHPSVILWSVGNEEWAIEGREIGARLTRLMQARVRELDPTRPATVATSNNDQSGNATVTEVAGFNYRSQHDADAYHRAHPETPIAMTEEGATTATRGIYFDDRDAVHLAAYDRPPRPIESSSIQQGWQAVAERPWMAGMFVWTGFDYRGETTPFGWPAISSQFGMLDTTGAFKDTGWYLKSQWSDAPMAHIVGHWTWSGREGSPIPLWVYANADEAELIVNGRSQGRKPIPANGHAEWQVSYAPGKVEAVSYRAGKPVARDTVETAGPPRSLSQSVEYPAGLYGRGRIAVVNVTARDPRGRIVPVAQDDVSFTVEGDAQILGVGNGDPGSHEADRFIEDVAVLRFRNWQMADVSPNQSTMPEVENLTWRDPFLWYPPGTGPKTPQTFALRGRLDAVSLTPGAQRTLFVPLLASRQRLFVNGVDLTDRARKDGEGWSVRIKDDGVPEIVLVVPDGEQALGTLQALGDHGNNVAYLQIVTPEAGWSRRLFTGHAQAIVRLGNGSGKATVTVRARGLVPASVVLAGTDTPSLAD